MNCIQCEITRSKLKAKGLRMLGWTLDEIARHLSECYGEVYSIRDSNIYRASKLPPYVPYLIYES